MNALENSIGETAKSIVLGKFIGRLHALANSPIPKVSENAQLLFDHTFNVQQGFDAGTLPSPAMASDLILFPKAGLRGEDGCVFAYSYKPTVKLNMDVMLLEANPVIEADLVRTSSIMETVQEGGFSQRLRIVYSKAIQQQIEWLEQNKIPPVPEDPRTTPKEKLLEKILGEERYLGDTGFRDWQKVIDAILDSRDPQKARDTLINDAESAIKADRQTPSAQYSEEALQTTLQVFTDAITKASADSDIHSELKNIRDNQSHFLFIREDLFNDRSMRNKLRKSKLSSIPGYKNIGPNARARLMAMVLIEITVEEILEEKKRRRETNPPILIRDR